jgi:ferrous iron transport protein A
MLMKTENVTHAFPLGMAGEGEKVKIVSITGGKNLAKRLLTLGLVEDTQVQLLHKQSGNGIVIVCGETRLALGLGMAQKIMVVPVV